jgi:hypothetical protein
MNPTHILTDMENNNGRIYLVSNRTHGYSTILPLAESNFIFFLKELYSIIEVDDYDISHKYLTDVNLKNKIISYLHNIFKSDTFTFAINNTSTDFFIELNELLVNHLRNDELLKKFKPFRLLEHEKQHMSSFSKLQNNPRIEPINECKQHTKEMDAKQKDKETILPYNYYEVSTENTISPSLDTTISPIQYSLWKVDECNENKDIFNKCAILYCVSQSVGIVIENQHTIFVEYLTKHFKDFELVKTYSQLNKKDLANIKNYFHKRNFENNETIFKKINSFEFLFDINNDANDNEIEALIIERYTIDNESKNMIKANEILTQLMIELQISNKDKMKRTKELSSILLSMGVKKKRMADGIYYYGIVSKQNLFLSSVGNIEEMYKKTVEEHKLESTREILTRLTSSCKNRSGPCTCLDVKGCDRVVVVVPNQ